MEFLVRLAQFHPTFRKPELEALARLADVDIEFLEYSEYVCSIF
jgi:tRNA (guanine10-N2)-methyltransferase